MTANEVACPAKRLTRVITAPPRKRHRNRAGETRVRFGERDIRPDRRATARAIERRKEMRRERRSAHFLCVGVGERLTNPAGHIVGRQRDDLGRGIADEHRPIELSGVPCGVHDRCDLVGALDRRNRQPGSRVIEGRELARAKPDHRHAERLERFEGPWQIENRFCAARYDGDALA